MPRFMGLKTSYHLLGTQLKFLERIGEQGVPKSMVLVGASRTHVDSLRRRGLVKEQGDQYVLTADGRQALEEWKNSQR
jgi:hypothetical protein